MNLLTAGFLVFSALGAPGEADGLSARGVILSKRPAASTYRLLLHRGGKSAEVPNNYEFRSGDKFALHVSVNEGAGYLYVLNRTISGSPERIRATAARGIQLASEGRPTNVTAEQEEDLLAKESASASEYRLVYPGTHRKVPRGWVAIPSGDLFEMDDNPGLEQLLVIVSPTPLTDFTKALATIPRTTAKSERMRAQQAVRGELAQMAANTEIAEPPIDARSIIIEDLPQQQPTGAGTAVVPVRTQPVKPSQPNGRKPNQGAAAPIQATRPYLIELTLVHL